MKKCFLSLCLSLAFFSSAQAFDYTDVLLWLPNRFLDLTDIISVGIGVGGIKGGIRVTRAIDFNAGDGFYIVGRKDYNRWIAGSLEQGHSLSFFYLGTENYRVDHTFAYKLWYYPLDDTEVAYNAKGVDYRYKWWENPVEGNYDLRNGTRDWFEIAAEIGIGPYLRVAIHPVEIADFILGIFFIDVIKKDDVSFSE